MRAYALAVAFAVTLTFPVSAFSQGIEIGPGGVRIERSREGRSVDRASCAELRGACLNKQELGEEGQGNCRKYREYCRHN
ncbi:hypothetical protein [Methylocella silvestris]|uniref:Uncharacterized protein n=1 Tax=Methylocella silvestris TaxID=199596 RepID=A0A2J7TFP7_METSI|nr:hypothetical protein [Methylocella silvestris]PNG25563.1 hypothetical protein CR492_12590 [Methylocella silvestris]